jgi:NAD+--dinitrogen-reductase ADP-D-ribosyltransferase
MSEAFPFPINLCNLAPWEIASAEFNAQPRPIHICGVRESNRPFFRQLDEEACEEKRGILFHDYMSVKFGLHLWPDYEANSRCCLRNSYIRFLRGWGIESNSIEGAVIKGWAHSRFGIYPSFHKQKLTPMMTIESSIFAVDLMNGRAHTNVIDSQLDLLYEYCQYECARRFPGQTHVTLYRGTHDPEEYLQIESRGRREKCVRLNNVSSFSSDREKAWEFGSTAWQSEVPLAKVFFYSKLLPDSLLKGEDEYLVIGGDYWVRELLF